jgi:hypothetical protein
VTELRKIAIRQDKTAPEVIPEVIPEDIHDKPDP